MIPPVSDDNVDDSSNKNPASTSDKDDGGTSNNKREEDGTHEQEGSEDDMRCRKRQKTNEGENRRDRGGDQGNGHVQRNMIAEGPPPSHSTYAPSWNYTVRAVVNEARDRANMMMLQRLLLLSSAISHPLQSTIPNNNHLRQLPLRSRSAPHAASRPPLYPTNAHISQNQSLPPQRNSRPLSSSIRSSLSASTAANPSHRRQRRFWIRPGPPLFYTNLSGRQDHAGTRLYHPRSRNRNTNYPPPMEQIQQSVPPPLQDGGNRMGSRANPREPIANLRSHPSSFFAEPQNARGNTLAQEYDKLRYRHHYHPISMWVGQRNDTYYGSLQNVNDFMTSHLSNELRRAIFHEVPNPRSAFRCPNVAYPTNTIRNQITPYDLSVRIERADQPGEIATGIPLANPLPSDAHYSLTHLLPDRRSSVVGTTVAVQSTSAINRSEEGATNNGAVDTQDPVHPKDTKENTDPPN